MRADSKPQPPASRSPETRGRGRPKYYAFDQYMQVWLSVREVMARTGQSANSVCLKPKIGWTVGGRDGCKLSYSVNRQTLRSLYHRAVRILKNEREERDEFLQALRLAKCISPRAAEPLPIAAWWNDELQRRLTQTN